MGSGVLHQPDVQLQLVLALLMPPLLRLASTAAAEATTPTFSWPRARIPFEDDPRLVADPDQAVALNNARMDLQVRTCIRLVPRRGEPDYAYFTDLGPHIECWNMFEPFPPKGRILVNAGPSCLEPMHRPHRPRRVFSDCDIEYVNHLYNCPRRRKPSPICPSGRLIMAKPGELRLGAEGTTTEAGEAAEEAAEGEGEEEQETSTTTGSSTATTEGGEAEAEETERTPEGMPEGGSAEVTEEGEERSGGTEQPQPEEEGTTEAQSIQSTTMEAFGSTEGPTIGPEVIDAVFGTSTTEPEPEITQTEDNRVTTQVPEPEPTTERTTERMPTTTSGMMRILTTLTTERATTTQTELTPEGTTTETTTFLPPARPITAEPFTFAPWTTPAVPDEPRPETEPPPMQPYPFMMTLITTTTTTTIAPPPPDWVRSVEESFRAANSVEDGGEALETRSPSPPPPPPTPTSSSSAAPEMEVGIGEPPDEPRPIVRPPPPGGGNSASASEEEEAEKRPPMVVGVIQVPPGSGLAIREKTKMTRVVEKTKYIGPCGSACNYGGQLVRLFRSVNNQPSVMDHFYTTERLEQHLMASQGFVMEPSMGFLGRNQIDPNCSCIRPLYRLYSGFMKDHFLTTAEQEKSIAEGLLGYVFERVLGYCTREPGCGAYLPLYRFFSAVNRDHFYTSDQQEMHYYKTHTELTYTFEKIECYVWQHSSSARACPAVPLVLEEKETRREQKIDERRRRR